MSVKKERKSHHEINQDYFFLNFCVQIEKLALSNSFHLSLYGWMAFGTMEELISIPYCTVHTLHSTCNSLGSCPNFFSGSPILSDSFFFLVRIRICSYMADYPTSIYIITGHAVHKGPKESILETLFVYLLCSLPDVNRIALRRQ